MLMMKNNVDEAVNGAAFATFVATGQTCIMGARLVIHESIFDEFIEKLVKKMGETTFKPPVNNKMERKTIAGSNEFFGAKLFLEK